MSMKKNYENRMASSKPTQQMVTVRRGFCHVVGEATYRYGDLATTDSPEYLANKAAWMLAPADLLGKRDTTPAKKPKPSAATDVAEDSEADED